MASRENWEQRLRQAGISPSDPKLQDLSEQLAIRLDKHVLETVKRQLVGPKLMVIWNDSRPSPSPRLYTLDEFKTYVKSRNPTDTKRTSETSEPAPGSVAIPKCDSDPPARGAGVEYFAILREHTGRSSEQVDTRAGTVAELYRELDERYRFPRMASLKVAINDEFRDWNSGIADGDSVVFIPPVAGG